MEDPELKNLLRENNRLEEENNRMLQYIYRSTRWTTIFSIVRWIIILAVAVGLFYYLKPIWDSLGTTYEYLTGHPLPDFPGVFKR